MGLARFAAAAAIVGTFVFAGVVAAEDKKDAKNDKKTRVLWKLDWPVAGQDEVLSRTQWVDLGDGKVAAAAAGHIRVFDKKTGNCTKTHVLPKGFENTDGTIVGRHLVATGPRQKPAPPRAAAEIGFDGGGEASTLQIYDLLSGRLVLEDESTETGIFGDKLIISGPAFDGLDLSKQPRRLWSAPVPVQRGGFVLSGMDVAGYEEGALSLNADDRGADHLVFTRFDWKSGPTRTVALPRPKFEICHYRFAGASVIVLNAERPVLRLAGYDADKQRPLYDVKHDMKGFHAVGAEVGVYSVWLESSSKKPNARAAKIIDLRTGAIVQEPKIMGEPLVSSKGVAWLAEGEAGAWSVVTLEKDGKLKTTGSFAKDAPETGFHAGGTKIFATREAGEKIELVSVDAWSGQARTLHECAKAVEGDRMELRVLDVLTNGDPVVAEIRRTKDSSKDPFKVLGLDAK